MNFSSSLLNWHEQNKRDLPWKTNRDPYAIWLSEIILQQTRVNQGLPYYLKFIRTYPDVHQLADANIDDVLKLWEGLGYYSRARNLHFTAKVVSRELKGKFPETLQEMLKLKGIGPYTASAILSFAFDKVHAAVDGNAYRIVSRYLGITDAIDEAATKKDIETWLNKNISKERPGDFNQAMMDLGSSICTPKNPKCDLCPFQKNCKANKYELTAIIPYKSKIITKKERYLHYFILKDNKNNTLIRKRAGKDIWASLHEFPLLEKDNGGKLTSAMVKKYISTFISDAKDCMQVHSSEEFVHLLTHQKIRARFYEFKVKSLKNKHIPAEWNLVNLENISTFAFPKLIQSYIETHLKQIGTYRK